MMTNDDSTTRTPDDATGKSEDKRPLREKLAPYLASGRMTEVRDGRSFAIVGGVRPPSQPSSTPSSPPTGVPSTAKPIAMMEAGPGRLTLAGLIAFGEKVIGRPPTPEELERMKDTLNKLGIK
jgi:hypothetical protein